MTGIVFLDVQKAFDKICHIALADKLIRDSVPPQFVIIYGSRSLCNVYTNAIPRKPNAKLAKFSDDTVGILTINNPLKVIETLRLSGRLFRLAKKLRIKFYLRKSAAIFLPTKLLPLIMIVNLTPPK